MFKEILNNGLIRTWDSACRWDVFYRVEAGRIIYAHGGTDSWPCRDAATVAARAAGLI